VKHGKLWIRPSQLSAVTLQIKPVSNSWSQKPETFFFSSRDQSHMLPVFPDLPSYAPLWSMHVHYVCVNRSRAQRHGAPRAVSHAAEATEVIMLYGKAAPLRGHWTAVWAHQGPGSLQPRGPALVLRYLGSRFGVYG